jgi:Concanavalin A-like lectin/glucanases superfamily
MQAGGRRPRTSDWPGMPVFFADVRTVPFRRAGWLCAAGMICAFCAGEYRAGAAESEATALRPAPVVWQFDRTAAIAGCPTEVLGAPRVVESAGERFVQFDGVRDGLIVPINPLAGLPRFTIEVLVRPEAGGGVEQRFLHVQDEFGNRVLLEIRLTPEGQWALDTFMLSGASRLTLLDRTRVHPAGRWHWVALRFDGHRMTSWVDGRQELEGAVEFAPMKSGQTSLGVRLNRVSWFKGAIREVRFHPGALAGDALQRAKGD